MKRNISPGLAIVVSEDDDYRLFLQRQECPNEELGLWLVVLTLERELETGKLIPATTCYYVLAEDERGAIQQVDDASLGTGYRSACDASELQKAGKLKATATRLPLHLRGWGLQTF